MNTPHFLQLGLSMILATSILPYVACLADDQPFAVGDHVATVVNTKVMKGTSVVKSLPSATSFIVKDVRGDWLGYVDSQSGSAVKGWVRALDVMAIPEGRKPLFATRDSLDVDQWQIVQLPLNASLDVTIQSDRPLDVMIVSEAAKHTLLMTPVRLHRRIRPREQTLDVRSGSLHWTPRRAGQYYLLIENGQIPVRGADCREPVDYMLTCTVAQTEPPLTLRPINKNTGRGDFAASKYRSAFEGITADETGREPIAAELKIAEDIANAVGGTMVRGIEQAFKNK